MMRPEDIITTSHLNAPHVSSPYFPAAHSADGLFTWSAGSPGYVGISCALSGLPDNTIGRVGLHHVYLQYAAGEIPDELLRQAREFSSAVSALKDARRQATDAEPSQVRTPRLPVCPRCNTFCEGDCSA